MLATYEPEPEHANAPSLYSLFTLFTLVTREPMAPLFTLYCKLALAANTLYLYLYSLERIDATRIEC